MSKFTQLLWLAAFAAGVAVAAICGTIMAIDDSWWHRYDEDVVTTMFVIAIYLIVIAAAVLLSSIADARGDVAPPSTKADKPRSPRYIRRHVFKGHFITITEPVLVDPSHEDEGEESMRRYFWALPLMVFCVGVEILILVLTYRFEAQFVPPGVTTAMGLGAYGATLFACELLKLPLAAFIGGAARGFVKPLAFVILLLLCLFTFEATKDMATNELVASLQPAEELGREIDSLRSENERLEVRIANCEDNTDAVQTKIADAHQAANARIDELGQRRDAELHRIDAMIEKAQNGLVLDPTRQAQIRQLESRDAQIREQSLSDLERLDAEIGAAIEHARLMSEEQGRAHQQAMEAWNAREAAKQSQYAAAVSGWQASVEQSRTTFEAELTRFDRERAAILVQIREVETARDAAIQQHQENDRPFYGLEGKIAQEQVNAESKLIPLRESLAALPRPSEPTTVARPQPPVSEPMPDVAGMDTSEVGALKDRKDAIVMSRNSELESIQTRIAAIYEEATTDSAVLQANADEQVQNLNSERRRVDEELTRQIEQVDQERNATVASLRESTMSAADARSAIEEANELILQNDGQITALGHDRDATIERTQIYRIAAFLGWFMPDRSIDERIVFSQSVIIPFLALLAAFLPALMLELSIGALKPGSYGLLTRRRGMRWMREQYQKRIRRRQQRHEKAIQAAESRFTKERDVAKANFEDAIKSLRQKHDLQRASDRGAHEGELTTARKQHSHQVALLEDEAKAERRRSIEVERSAAEQVVQTKADAEAKAAETQWQHTREVSEIQRDADARARASMDKLHQATIDAREIVSRVRCEKREEILDVKESRSEDLRAAQIAAAVSTAEAKAHIATADATAAIRVTECERDSGGKINDLTQRLATTDADARATVAEVEAAADQRARRRYEDRIETLELERDKAHRQLQRASLERDNVDQQLSNSQAREDRLRIDNTHLRDDLTELGRRPHLHSNGTNGHHKGAS